MKISVCFSGQGAQKAGMFKDFIDMYEKSKYIFEIASEECGFDVMKVCFEDPDKVLNQTIFTQPCVLACDVAAFLPLKERNIKVDYVAGFSLGEYAALFAAGCLEVKEVFKLIKIRAKAMQEAVPIGEGGMLAVVTDDFNKIEEICEQVTDGYAQIANYNSPNQIVISGLSKTIDNLFFSLRKENIKCIKLPVSAPFHCELMKPAEEALEKEFEKINFRTPTIPIVMNYDGRVTTDVSEIKKKVIHQTIGAVRWIDSVKCMKNNGTSLFIECGPGRTLSKFIMSIAPERITTYINDSISLEQTLDIIDKNSMSF